MDASTLSDGDLRDKGCDNARGDVDRDEYLPDVRAAADATLVDQWLYLDVRGTATQNDVNPFVAGGGDVASYGNKAKILQEGREFAVAEDNVAAIIQRGDEMRSLIDQDGSANAASILQTGNNGSANASDFEDNEARITQVGFFNAGAILQDGMFQLASIDQFGNGNNASIEQDGIEFGNGNTALIGQFGDDNEAAIGQDGDGNMASSVQEGNMNFSSIWQSGLDNMAAAIQTGDMNYSAIEQMGDGNQASVMQDGFDWADVQQHGNGNVAGVWQQ